MYNEHFGLRQAPFRITPDTRLFYTGGARGDVLDALVYAITSGEGIVKVVGEVGTGKTMLCRMLEERLPENVQIAYLANPSLTPDDILHAIALELGLELIPGETRLQVMHRLQETLLALHARNRRVVALVEEAQRMPIDTLEEIRLLSNLETKNEKLLQIVLFGQLELDDNLAQPGIRQLRERITHSFRLAPLVRAEIKDYVAFRLRASGYRGRDAFSNDAYRAMSRASEGLTRRVNIIADKAMLAAFAENTHDVSARHVKVAIRDSEFDAATTRRARGASKLAIAAGIASAAIVAGAAGWFLGQRDQAGSERSVAGASAPAPAGARVEVSLAAGAGDDSALAAAVSARAAAADATAHTALPTQPSMPLYGGSQMARDSDWPPPAQPPSAAHPRERAAAQLLSAVPPQATADASAPQPDAARAPLPSSVALPAAAPVAPSSLPASAASITMPATVAAAADSAQSAVRATSPATAAQPVAASTAPTPAPPGSATPAVASSSLAASPRAATVPGAPDPGEQGQLPAAAAAASGHEVSVALAAAVSPAEAPSSAPVPVASAAVQVQPSAAPLPRAPASPVAPVSPQGLLDQRLVVTRAWLDRVNPGHFSIQLLATDARQRNNLEAFLRRRSGELDALYVYETRINERVWFGVLYGEFDSISAAREVLRTLPEELLRHAPFIRNISDITTLG